MIHQYKKFMDKNESKIILLFIFYIKSYFYG